MSWAGADADVQLGRYQPEATWPCARSKAAAIDALIEHSCTMWLSRVGRAPWRSPPLAAALANTVRMTIAGGDKLAGRDAREEGSGTGLRLWCACIEGCTTPTRLSSQCQPQEEHMLDQSFATKLSQPDNPGQPADKAMTMMYFASSSARQSLSRQLLHMIGRSIMQ